MELQGNLCAKEELGNRSNGPVQVKEIDQLTVSEFLELKKDVNAIYGEGEFKKAMGLNIEKINPSPVTSFKDILKGTKNVNKNSTGINLTEVVDISVPLKSIANPKIEGGNVVVEVDDED